MAAFLEDAMTEGPLVDGVIAESSSQAENIWALREQVSIPHTNAFGNRLYGFPSPQKSF